MQEVYHYNKRALSFITNGETANSILDSNEKYSDIIEAGRYFESLLFNWKNEFNKRPKSQDKNKKNIIDEKLI